MRWYLSGFCFPFFFAFFISVPWYKHIYVSIIAGALVACALEMVQFSGGIGDPLDLFFSVLGGFIGFLLLTHVADLRIGTRLSR